MKYKCKLACYRVSQNKTSQHENHNVCMHCQLSSFIPHNFFTSLFNIKVNVQCLLVNSVTVKYQTSNKFPTLKNKCWVLRELNWLTKHDKQTAFSKLRYEPVSGNSTTTVPNQNQFPGMSESAFCLHGINDP